MKFDKPIPTKVILFGEHSVLKGSKAISFAINRFGTARRSTGCTVIDPSKEIDFSNKFPTKEGIQIKLDVMLGSGLGTSAVISIFLAQIELDREFEYAKEIIEIDSKKTNKVLNRALQIENVFHGVSSGLDVTTSFVTGLIMYQNYSYRRLPTQYIKNYKILIYDSKLVKNTKDANKNSLMTDEMVKTIDDIASEAESLLSDVFKIGELYKLIRRNQDVLDKMNVVPVCMANEILRLRERGIECKLTGAGNGGHLVTFVEKDVVFDGWEEVKIFESTEN